MLSAVSTSFLVAPTSLFRNRAFTAEPGKTWDGHHKEDSKRMPTQRCAKLIAVSMANDVDEAWISIQPILTIYYLYQYFPSTTRKLLCRLMTKERVAKLRDG